MLKVPLPPEVFTKPFEIKLLNRVTFKSGMVEELKAIKPFMKLTTVEVETPKEVTVKGNVAPELPQPVQVPEIVRFLVNMPLYSLLVGVDVPI